MGLAEMEMPMKCRRIGLKCDVEKYEFGKGLEDGFELFTDVVTKGWIATEHLLQLTREDGSIVCPYIIHRRGRNFIWENDYIIIEEDGTKHVCGEEKIWARFKRI